jgi:hypothetical protein
MKKVVAELGQLTPEDQLAIWNYLKSLPPHPNALGREAEEAAASEGEESQ